MPSLNLRRSLSSRSLLALVPVAALAAVFALGVPGEGSGAPCESDTECPDGEACGEGVCESVAGGCGGEQDSGIGVASTQAEGALLAPNMGTQGQVLLDGPPPSAPPPVAYTVAIGPKSYSFATTNNSFFTSLNKDTFRSGDVRVTPAPCAGPVYYGACVPGVPGARPPSMCGEGQEGLHWGGCPAGQKCEAFSGSGGGSVCSGGGPTTSTTSEEGQEGEGEGEGEGGTYCGCNNTGAFTDCGIDQVCVPFNCMDTGATGGFTCLSKDDSFVKSGKCAEVEDSEKDCSQRKLACNSPTRDPDLSSGTDPEASCIRAYCDEDGDGTYSSADLGLVLLSYGSPRADTAVTILPNWTTAYPERGSFTFPRFNPSYRNNSGVGPGEWVNGRDLAQYLATMVGAQSTGLEACAQRVVSQLKLPCNSPTWDPALGCMRDYCDEDGNGVYNMADAARVLANYGPPADDNTLVTIVPNWPYSDHNGSGSFDFPRFNPAYDRSDGRIEGEEVNGLDFNVYLETLDGSTSTVLGVCTPPPAVNVPPVASTAGSTPLAGYAPLAVKLVGTASSDTDGTIASYRWEFGDGSWSTTTTAIHTYAAGTYTARLVVTDNLGAASASTTVQIVVSSAPPPTPPHRDYPDYRNDGKNPPVGNPVEGGSFY